MQNLLHNEVNKWMRTINKMYYEFIILSIIKLNSDFKFYRIKNRWKIDERLHFKVLFRSILLNCQFVYDLHMNLNQENEYRLTHVFSMCFTFNVVCAILYPFCFIPILCIVIESATWMSWFLCLHWNIGWTENTKSIFNEFICRNDWCWKWSGNKFNQFWLIVSHFTISDDQNHLTIHSEERNSTHAFWIQFNSLDDQ